MNKNDSERIAYLMNYSGHKETSEKEADLIIVNACAVRTRVVDKIIGKINNLPKEKTLILTGCVLPKEKVKLIDKFDYFLDIIDLPHWGKKIDFLKYIKAKNYFSIKAKRKKPVAYIPIMTGCDNFCSYCAVPYVRGRERSRPIKEIIQEIESLVQEGFKEIWLLGQNVNSYNKGHFPDFANLLSEINNIKGDFWIRFTSSHPKDFSNKLIKTMKNCNKVTEYLNLPIQSGDNQILKLMNRPYTVEKYKKIIKRLRTEIPEITISTDIIVGFPQETRKAFENTMKLFKEIQFDMAYIARYSPRPHTAAAKLEETVSEEEKKKRKQELTEILKKSALKRNQLKINQNINYLALKHDNGIDIGKTRCYKTIKVNTNNKKVGVFKKAKITDADYFGLKGTSL